jgi:hypothetical protein
LPRNTQRQPQPAQFAPSSTPPTTGPEVAPSPIAAPYHPSAVRRSHVART